MVSRAASQPPTGATAIAKSGEREQKRERTFRRIRSRGVDLDLNFDRAIIGNEMTRLEEPHVIAEMAEARITGDELCGNSLRDGNHQLGRAGR